MALDGQKAVEQMDPRFWTCHIVGRCLPSNAGKIYLVDLLLDVAVHIRSKPYRAQGAAMAIEDAAVLGNLLSRISHMSQLGSLLKAYEDLRLPRTSVVQESSRLNQHIFHLPDGPEQRERDANMRKAMALELAGKTDELQRGTAGNQNQWADRAKSNDLFGYDADAEVDKWWAAHGRELEDFVRSKL